jgi:malic enzyme
MDNTFNEALTLHENLMGKLVVSSKVPADSKEALALLYTPRGCGTVPENRRR